MSRKPLIRDVLTIDDSIWTHFGRDQTGDPMILLGRVVRHAPGYQLVVTGRPVIIVADEYDGNGGSIDASGEAQTGDASALGQNGVDGPDAPVKPYPHTSLNPPPPDIPHGPGGNGTNGTNGGNGRSGQNVTLLARKASSVAILTFGAPGYPGGSGGRGGTGGDGWDGTQDADGNPVVEGFNGTRGGWGGNGGNGGNGGDGGNLQVLTIHPVVLPGLVNHAGLGGDAGAGGTNGSDGYRSTDTACAPELGIPCQGTSGTSGTAGSGTAAVCRTMTEAEYLAQVRSTLDFGSGQLYVNYWAPVRLLIGEFYFRQFQSGSADAKGFGTLAARELQAALEFQPDNVEALRLRALLGSPGPASFPAEAPWTAGGSNALGLSIVEDVLPLADGDFTGFADAFERVKQFFAVDLPSALAANTVAAVQQLATSQQTGVQAEVATAQKELSQAQITLSADSTQVTFVQQRLNSVAASLSASLPFLRSQGFSLDGVTGTVADAATAILSIVGVLPSSQVGLVALVPALVAIPQSIVSHSAPVAQRLLASESADTSAVQAAYTKIGYDPGFVAASGMAFVDFARVARKIGSGVATDVAVSVTSVKLAAELIHQLLLAKNQVALTQRRTAAMAARLSRATALRDSLVSLPTAIPDAVLLAIQCATAGADGMLTLCVRAQRTLEIYTLQEPSSPAPLDAAWVSPDLTSGYYDNMVSAADLIGAYSAAWAKLPDPGSLQNQYKAYFQQPGLQLKVKTLSFSDVSTFQQLSDTRNFSFFVETGDLAADDLEAKVRLVAVALVGATSPGGVLQCNVWHESRYEQLQGGQQAGAPAILNSQVLRARGLSMQASNKTLTAEAFPLAAQPPLYTPGLFHAWGRGVCGRWSISLSDATIDIAALSSVDVWIGYGSLKAL